MAVPFRALSIALLLCFSLFAGLSFGGQTRIAVLLSKNALPYSQALSAFKGVLAERGISAELSTFDIDGSLEEGHNSLKEIRTLDPRMILAIGSTATEVAHNEAKDYTVIYTMVIYPEDSGFISRTGKRDITGVAMDIPPSEQFKVLMSLVPRAKRIGVLYDPRETGTVIEDAKEAARKIGIELVAVRILSAREVPDALSQLRGRVDALWSVADSTVMNSKSIRYIITFSLRNRIPFMGISSYFVKEGALISLSPDYYDIGRQTGEMAALALKGTPPSNIKPLGPRKFVITINLRTARKIGLSIPRDVLATAQEVIE